MRSMLLAAVVLGIVVSISPLPVLADGQAGEPAKAAAPADLQNRLDRLQTLVEQQQQTIEQLETKLNVANSTDMNAARVEEIKKVVREVMADGQFRESLYPDVVQVGYDHGFYIKSSDEAFLLNIQGLLQVRYVGNERQRDNPRIQGRNPQDDVNGFEISKLFLTFAGHIHTDKLTYQITVKGDTVVSNQWTTYYAFVNYEVVEEFQVQAGIMDIPQGRQFLTWDSKLQFCDRSLAEETFGLGQSAGVMFHGTLVKRVSYMAGVFNGIANPWDSPSREELDTNFAYAARLVGHLLGQGIDDETDLEFSKDPKLDIGTSFYYNDDNGDRTGPGLLYNIPERIRSGRGIGGNAVTDATGTDYFGFGADVAFRYRGFSLTAEWFLRSVDSDSEYSPWFLMTTRDGSSHSQGGYIQAGYFIVPKRLEVAARMGGVWDNGDDNTWEYSFGVNYYPFGSHNFKIQADFTHIDEASVTSDWIDVNQNDSVNLFRVNLQAAFE
jgi:phosphate-selective porin OprO and OprP